MSDPLKSALAVLDAYMAGLNRGDEVAVNAACNFPHVRIAGGQVVVWQKRGEYRLDDFRARFDSASDQHDTTALTTTCFDLCEHDYRAIASQTVSAARPPASPMGVDA